MQFTFIIVLYHMLPFITYIMFINFLIIPVNINLIILENIRLLNLVNFLRFVAVTTNNVWCFYQMGWSEMGQEKER